jgi:hypothetical protein
MMYFMMYLSIGIKKGYLIRFGDLYALVLKCHSHIKSVGLSAGDTQQD